jgi:hypothetical protein
MFPLSYRESEEAVKALYSSVMAQSEIQGESMKVTIVFDRDQLTTALQMLRDILGEGEDWASEHQSSEQRVQELLRLSDLVKQRFNVGHLFEVQSKIMITEGAGKTLLSLEPTQWMAEYHAAIGMGTLNH